MARAARRSIACSAAAVLAAFAAGCGGSGSASDTATHPALTPQQQRGKTLFIERCGACHTLSDAGTHGVVGKNLDVTRPTYAQVLASLAAPPQNMPRNLLPNAADAKAVAAYVAAVTRAR